MQAFHLKATAVLLMGMAALFVPNAAAASASAMFVGCNELFPADCQNKTIGEITIICNAVCSGWQSAACYQDGDLECRDYIE